MGLGCNNTLCVVIDKDLFGCMVNCAVYSDEFLYNRVRSFMDNGVPSNSTNSIAVLARMVKDLGLSDTVVKYMVSRQYVISSDVKIGTFTAGHKPYSILRKEDGLIKIGGEVKLEKS